MSSRARRSGVRANWPRSGGLRRPRMWLSDPRRGSGQPRRRKSPSRCDGACGCWSGHAIERHDRQMLLAVVPGDDELQPGAGVAPDLGGGRGAGGAARPVGSRLEAGASAGGGDAAVAFLGRPTAQSGVRTMVVVPEDVGSHGLTHGRDGQRYEDAAGGLVLEGADEAFDHGDAAVTADGPEAPIPGELRGRHTKLR